VFIFVLVLKADWLSFACTHQLPEDKSLSFGQQPLTITVEGQEIALVEEFVYLGSLVQSATQS